MEHAASLLDVVPLLPRNRDLPARGRESPALAVLKRSHQQGGSTGPTVKPVRSRSNGAAGERAARLFPMSDASRQRLTLGASIEDLASQDRESRFGVVPVRSSSLTEMAAPRLFADDAWADALGSAPGAQIRRVPSRSVRREESSPKLANRLKVTGATHFLRRPAPQTKTTVGKFPPGRPENRP